MANTLINVEIFGQAMGAELPNKLKFAPLAIVGTELTQVAGDTLVRAKYSYIGEASLVAPGAAISTSDMNMTSQKVKVTKSGKGVQLLDEDVVIRGQEIIDETYSQLEKSILDKIDTDCLKSLKSTAVIHDASTAEISYEAIVDAVSKLGEEDDESKVLFINSKQKAKLLKDPNFIKATAMGDERMMKGVVGEVAGCQVVVSNKIKAEAGKYNNLIVKAGALAIELKRAVKVEESRVAKNQLTEYYAVEHFATYLRDESKCIKLVTKIEA